MKIIFSDQTKKTLYSIGALTGLGVGIGYPLIISITIYAVLFSNTTLTTVSYVDFSNTTSSLLLLCLQTAACCSVGAYSLAKILHLRKKSKS